MSRIFARLLKLFKILGERYPPFLLYFSDDKFIFTIFCGPLDPFGQTNLDP